jgi:hypothetical protein
MGKGRIVILIMALIFSSVSRAADFSYEDLTNLIQSQGLKSVEEVLPRLPIEMRTNYTLMYFSRSLQSATSDFPRAILFGENGKLTCAFNGDPSQYGYDSMECFQFRSEERRFDFRQIQFPTSQNGLDKVQFSLPNQTVDRSVSCLVCHSKDPRPNWDNYNFWPAAYGEHEDNLGLNEGLYQKYIGHRDDHPRYKWLIQEKFSLAPYRKSSQDVSVAHRPNFRMSDIFGRLNGLRAARILSENLPSWERWAYVVAAFKCSLTFQQLATLAAAGFRQDDDLQMEHIFRDVGLKSFEWSTQISADPQNYPDKPWEHQSGFSMFSETVAMALIQERATAGNSLLTEALEKIRIYFLQNYYAEELRFNQILNGIVPSPDFFGQGYVINRASLCPEVANIFVTEYLRSH